MKNILPWFCAILLSSCAGAPKQFHSPLVVTPLRDGKHWIVKNDLVYQDAGIEKPIVVPRGFVTDFASVPRSVWSIYPTTGPYTAAAVLHDYLYWKQDPQISKKKSDNIFYDAMTSSGTPDATRNIFYNAVDKVGFLAWNKNAELKKSGERREYSQGFMDEEFDRLRPQPPSLAQVRNEAKVWDIRNKGTASVPVSRTPVRIPSPASAR